MGSRIHRCSATFCRRNPVISIGINVIGSFSSGWKNSPQILFMFKLVMQIHCTDQQKVTSVWAVLHRSLCIFENGPFFCALLVSMKSFALLWTKWAIKQWLVNCSCFLSSQDLDDLQIFSPTTDSLSVYTNSDIIRTDMAPNVPTIWDIKTPASVQEVRLIPDCKYTLKCWC